MTQAMDQEVVRRISAVLMRRAHRARLDICDFFEFVFREEHQRTALTVAPHQRVMFEFAQAHPKCVLMLPVGHGKTYSVAALGLYGIARDRLSRGAFVSATQAQAQKPLGMLKDYIESSFELRLAFPDLIPSRRQSDSWTQTEITVDRPPGIRDSSFMAAGMDSGAIPGSRLKWINVDDILNRENTSTKDQRDKVYEWIQTSVISRLDPRDSFCCVTNTAWHPNDLLHRLRDEGWPTLRMEIGGTVEVYGTDWDPKRPEDLRPEQPGSHLCRLGRHDPDDENRTPLFPARFSDEIIEELKRRNLPIHFNQLYRNITRDDATSRCKVEYIDTCLQRARTAVTPAHHEFVSFYDGPNQTFTGLDLAISPGEEHDDVAFFTFEVTPQGYRRILDIEAGQWPGPEIVKKIIDKARRYKSVIRVENNGAQDYIRQFTLDADISIPIKAHCTGRVKAHPEYGVEGLFIELMNGAWLIPSRGNAAWGPSCSVHPGTKRFIESCLYYSPSKHTDDVLMACYFAREQAREFGILSGSDTANMGATALNLMAR
jgi:hypothetical protein